ncbi:FAD-dependent oxidoreductase [Georgenia halophila]|uniref:FAD-dependent oxidoreductase n=1 Tax=Georgenia halophila TaxID=620889 RepID=A0ABP8L7E7_9MICO
MSVVEAPERVVVVGFGPVAARLVEELRPAVRAGHIELLVLGEESVPAYNRVLVGDVAVGRTTEAAIAMAGLRELWADGVQVMLDTPATAIDRHTRQVVLADGRTARYDRLVLATGAHAAIPPLAGLDPTHRRLPEGVTTLRDLGDARRVRAAVGAGQRLVVLGAGALGLEAALAAAEEGADVTVAFAGRVPLDRNIDLGGGRVLVRELRRLGVGVVGGAVSTGVELDRDGRFRALVLDDDTEVTGDLLLLSVGVRARVGLARTCALGVGKGILVDHGLRADPDGTVFAIGDCAEVLCGDADCSDCAGREGRGPAGLVGPGWRQASWLAAHLTGAGPEPLGPEPRDLILLKARSVDLVAAGDTTPEPWDEERGGSLAVAQWADPQHGRYVKMVTRDGGLTGVVCVGMPRTAAELVLLFERAGELPADRTTLFRLDAAGQEAAGTPPGPESTVCRCTGATLGSIEDAIGSGCSSVVEVGRATRAGTGCGGCHETIRERLAARAASSAVPSGTGTGP